MFIIRNEFFKSHVCVCVFSALEKERREKSCNNFNRKGKKLFPSLTFSKVSLNIHNAHSLSHSLARSLPIDISRCRTRLIKMKEEKKTKNFWHHSNWNYEDEIAIETLPYYNFCLFSPIFLQMHQFVRSIRRLSLAHFEVKI
jgi:hypothetical protein